MIAGAVLQLWLQSNPHNYKAGLFFSAVRGALVYFQAHPLLNPLFFSYLSKSNIAPKAAIIFCNLRAQVRDKLYTNPHSTPFFKHSEDFAFLYICSVVHNHLDLTVITADIGSSSYTWLYTIDYFEAEVCALSWWICLHVLSLDNFMPFFGIWVNLFTYETLTVSWILLFSGHGIHLDYFSLVLVHFSLNLSSLGRLFLV